MGAEADLAVREAIGQVSVKSAARMNGAVLLVLEKVEQLTRVVGTGMTEC